MKAVNPQMTDEPCPRCLRLAQAGRIRAETIQRMPKGAWAPMGLDRKKCCFDCASADGLIQFGYFKDDEQGFLMARIAVGEDRQAQYRLPGVPMGLVMTGHVRPSALGDFEKHIAWLEKNDWFGTREVERT